MFRGGDDVVLLSRSGKDLGRYFPEVLDSVRDELAPRCVLGGEIVAPREIGGRTRLDWESLSQRSHPAESRVRKLSQETPAHFIGFDALATGDTSRDEGTVPGPACGAHRRRHAQAVRHVTRTTEDAELGTHWLEELVEAGLDGVIAKRLDGPYLPGKREMIKVKHHRDADCVAIGYRIHKSGEGVGSILLGLRRDDGELQIDGGAASFTVKARLSLLAELEPLRIGDDVGDGEPSRWNSAADKRWIPIHPEKVGEVAYDQMEGNHEIGRRFRHAVKFLRWRPDRDPESCRFDQLDAPLNYDLYDVLEKSGRASEATGKRN